jgi:diguanylate cyclase (GGDEF)-like protein
LPGVGVDEAEKTANRLRLRVADCGLTHAASATGHVTASAGVAAVVPTTHETPADLLERADGALYRAKRDGRNRVARFG